MLSSLISGTRDVRAPLAVGLTLAAALWFYFGPRIPTESEASGLAAFLYRTTAALGPSASLASGLFIAYLMGSIAVRVAGQLRDRLEAFGRTTAYTIYDRFAHPDRPMRRLAAFANGWTSIQNPGRRGRHSTFPIERLIRERLDDAPDSLLREMSRSAQLALPEVFGYSQDVMKLTPADMKDGLTSVSEYRVHQEYAGLTTRLQVKNKDLYNDYDRLKAESDLRISLALPLAILAAALGVRWSPWFFAVALLSPALWMHGHELKYRAEDILAQAIVEGVMTSPTLDELDSALKRARWRAQQEG